jgi:hypothetical protein
VEGSLVKKKKEVGGHVLLNTKAVQGFREGVSDIELRERASLHCPFCSSSSSQFQLPLLSAMTQLFLQLLLIAVQAIF